MRSVDGFSTRADPGRATPPTYFVYVLQSTIGPRTYVGQTWNPEIRLAQHNEGKCRPTRHWRPWKLAHVEQFASRAEAMRRERFLKTGKGREELKRIFASKSLE